MKGDTSPLVTQNEIAELQGEGNVQLLLTYVRRSTANLAELT
jgi:hypothetical protein